MLATNSPPSESELGVAWHSLLSQCRATNQLYFLLVLMEGWSQGRHTRYGVQVNQLIQSIMLASAKDGRVHVERLHEVLLLMQLVLEDKHWYSLIRNFTSILTTRLIHPMPWRKDLCEYRIRGGYAVLNTSRIIANIVDDLRTCGHSLLADEFSYMSSTTKDIRNAVAHASFVLPETVPNDPWIFGTYREDAVGALGFEEIHYGHDEFEALALRFFRVRFSFINALGSIKSALRLKPLEFTSPSQLDPAIAIQCRYADGVLEIKNGKHLKLY